MERTVRRVSDIARQVLRRVSTATLAWQLLKTGLRNMFLGGVAPLRPPWFPLARADDCDKVSP